MSNTKLNCVIYESYCKRYEFICNIHDPEKLLMELMRSALLTANFFLIAIIAAFNRIMCLVAKKSLNYYMTFKYCLQFLLKYGAIQKSRGQDFGLLTNKNY